MAIRTMNDATGQTHVFVTRAHKQDAASYGGLPTRCLACKTRDCFLIALPMSAQTPGILPIRGV